MFELNGKVCLVTGGSRGLGESMAVTFAKAGAEAVIITYNSCLLYTSDAADE